MQFCPGYGGHLLQTASSPSSVSELVTSGGGDPSIESLPGGGYRLQASTVVHRPVDRTFEFFANAENLDAITPPWLQFRITTPLPIEMGEGTVIDYALKLHMFPVRWQSRIENWLPNSSFTDVQVLGPYRSWRHTHTFTELSSGLTLVKDKVVYRVPGGALVHRLVVRRDVLRIFRFRQKRLAELLEPDSK